MKFAPEHFPNGTIFEINEDVHFDKDGPNLFEVTGIVRNDIDNYVLKTAQVREHTGQVGFAIGHVKRIIKRGNGPVQIDYGWYGIKHDPRVVKDVVTMRLTKPIGYRFMPRKGYHNTGSLQSVLYYEASKLAKPAMLIDWTRLSRVIREQPWCAEVFPWRNTLAHMPVLVINKKRLRKFIKVNLNRFLVKYTTAIKLNEEARAKEYYEDMEYEFERDLKNAQAGLPHTEYSFTDEGPLTTLEPGIAEEEPLVPGCHGTQGFCEEDYKLPTNDLTVNAKIVFNGDRND